MSQKVKSYKRSKPFMQCLMEMCSYADPFNPNPLYKINMGAASGDERYSEHKRVNRILEGWIKKGWLVSKAANPENRYFYLYLAIDL